MMEGNKSLLRSYMRYLSSKGRSVRTKDSYAEGLELLAAFCDDRPFEELEKTDIEKFIADQLARHKPGTAATRFRSLRAFYNWLVDIEELRVKSPMHKMSEPKTPKAPVPILPDDAIKSLLKVTAGKRFEDRRDHAIIRTWLDSGVRLGEMAGINAEDIDLDKYDTIYVTGKTGSRNVPFGPKTGTALDRYKRMRKSHRHASKPGFWLGPKGPLTTSGITQMLRRRTIQAGLDRTHPHLFRHLFAHNWKASGGSEEDLMMIAGWESPEMVRRYGKSAAVDRAVKSHKRLGPGDRY